MSQEPVREDDLSDWGNSYDNMEKGLEWPEDYGKHSTQYFSIIQTLHYKLRNQALADKLSPLTYRERLGNILYFSENLNNAIHDKKYEKIIWRHQDTDELMTGYSKEEDRPTVGRGELLEVAEKYLIWPWVQCKLVDFILIDAFIYLEAMTLSKAILSGRAIGKMNLVYLLTQGNPLKTMWIKSALKIAVWLLRYVVPLGVIYLIYRKYSEETTMIAAGFYLAYLALRLVLWPSRYRTRKARNKELEEMVERCRRIVEAYFYCRPPIINIPILLKYLDVATESRPIFEGALYSIIKRVHGEYGDTLMPYANVRVIE